MKSRFYSLLIVLILAVLGTGSSPAQTDTISTNHVRFNFANYGINPNVVRSATVQAKAWAPLAGTFYVNSPITIGVGARPDLTNGTVVFSNLVCGVPYSVTFAGYSTWTTNIFIQSDVAPDANGEINAYGYQGSYTAAGQFFYANFRGQTNFPAAAITNATWITNNSSGLTLAGAFSGNAGGLTNLNYAGISNAPTTIANATNAVTATNAPDGLPIISKQGATNAAAGLFVVSNTVVIITNAGVSYTYGRTNVINTNAASGSSANAVTNLTAYTMTFLEGQTNPISVYSTYDTRANGIYTWSLPMRLYTNNSGNSNKLFKLQASIDVGNTGGWVVGAYTNDPSLDLNLFYYAASKLTLPIYDQQWLYQDGNFGDNQMLLIGTTSSTNSAFTMTHQGVTYIFDDPSWGQAAHIQTIKNVFGQPLYDVVAQHSALSRFAASYFYAETNFSFVPNATGGTANDGLQAYGWNLASSYNGNSDKRFDVGVGFLHGTNGANGATFEILNQTRAGYSANASWNSSGFNRALVVGVQDDISVGGLPYDQHGKEIRKLGWLNIVGSTDTTRPQIILDQMGAYTGVMTNGGLWADGTNIYAIEQGVSGKIITSALPYSTSSNPTNSFTTGTTYTNVNGRTLLTGSAVLASGVSGNANITLFYTNNGTGYQLPMQVGLGIAMSDFIPFSVPLSTNATFRFVATMGSGASGYLTNVVNWQQ